MAPTQRLAGSTVVLRRVVAVALLGVGTAHGDVLRFDSRADWNTWSIPQGAMKISADGSISLSRADKNITAVANADCARAPLLVIGGAVPRPQAGKGALQALPQTDLMRPITRYAATANEPDRVPGMLDDAFRAARGDAGSPGPAFL